MFRWDYIPGNDNARLKEFLIHNFGIDWVNEAMIEKIDHGRAIKVSSEKNNISLWINYEITNVHLEIDDGRTDELIVRKENGRLDIWNRDVRERTMKEIKNLGRPAVKSLIQALKNDYGDTGLEIIVSALSEIVDSRDEKAVESLIQAMIRISCRDNVSKALIRIGERAVMPLIGLFKHEDENIRECAAFALLDIRDSVAIDKKAVKPLIQALKDRNGTVRQVALGTLIKIGRPGVKSLIQALDDEEDSSLELVVWALSEIVDSRDKKAVEPIIKALNRFSCRVYASKALIKIGKPAAELLLDLSNHKDKEVRQLVIETLEKIRDKRATESFEKLGHKMAPRKWTLDIERKNIEIRIDKDQFILETPDCKIQFELSLLIANKMLEQFRAVVTPPNIPKQSLGEEINGKTLIMGLILDRNDHWIIDLQYGNDKFYAELTLNDIDNICTVLDGYLN